MSTVDVSAAFSPNLRDSHIISEMTKLPQNKQLEYFILNEMHLTHYVYWFALSSLWVDFGENKDISIWRQLFSSDRPSRQVCIMKPSELKDFNNLPDELTVFRAYCPAETECISYTLDFAVAMKFALMKPNGIVRAYYVSKRDVIAYFTRRNEHEILVLDSRKVNSKCPGCGIKLKYGLICMKCDDKLDAKASKIIDEIKEKLKGSAT